MPIENNPWIRKREKRRLAGLVLPITIMLIAIRSFMHSYTITEALEVIGLIFLCIASVSWAWYWRYRYPRSVSALMPVGTLRSVTGWPDGTSAELVAMGWLSFSDSHLVWASRRNASIRVTWSADQIGHCATKRVWGVVPSYYLAIAQPNGIEVILWTHYAPATVEHIRKLQTG